MYTNYTKCMTFCHNKLLYDTLSCVGIPLALKQYINKQYTFTI